MNWVAMLEWVATWKYLMDKSKFTWEREGHSRWFLYPQGVSGRISCKLSIRQEGLSFPFPKT